MTPDASLHDAPQLIGLSVALGIGLLVGAERERRKREGPDRQAAGIRTFALAAVAAAVAHLLAGPWMLALVVLLVGIGAWVAYASAQRKRRAADHDPGTTTEVALILTTLLGGLAMRDATLAAGLAALMALLLFSRQGLHHLVLRVLSEQEMRDILVFAGVALILWPLSPDRYLGPFDALNPQALVRLLVLVMGINAIGYVAVRALGPQQGLPLAGFAAGFISSTATIHAMGQRGRRQPDLLGPAVAGAILSSVATFFQLALVLWALHPPLLQSLAGPLMAGTAAAVLYALPFLFRDSGKLALDGQSPPGQAFDLKAALGFALIMAAVLVVSAGLNAWLGQAGLLVGAAVAGLADAHANAASAATLVVNAKLALDDARMPVLVGLSSNALMKALVAWRSGGAPFARRIVPGLALVLAALWLGVWLG